MLAYAAKYASAFYGPFREAVESSLEGDRKTYQQDPANRRASRCARWRSTSPRAPTSSWSSRPCPTSTCSRAVADAVDVPVAAYQVSGEYAMVEAAAANGWIDRERAMLETLTSIRAPARRSSSPTGPSTPPASPHPLTPQFPAIMNLGQRFAYPTL